MNNIISQIVGIIGDYRAGEDNVNINNDHVLRWVNQFDASDREFILTEFLHLLPSSYLTQEHTFRILGNSFDSIIGALRVGSVVELLRKSKFIDCQRDEKSQKVFLKYIGQILAQKYSFDIRNCGVDGVEYWIYVDDILASGGTFKSNIITEINNIGVDVFCSSRIKIVGLFVILHRWAFKKVPFALGKHFNKDFNEIFKFFRVAEVENDPKINSYNKDPKFNHVYPISYENGGIILDFIDEKIFPNHGITKNYNSEYAWRNPADPNIETFYSSPQNRIRYEHILLQKGYDIMQKIDYIDAPGLRPLGMTNPSNKTLGTGTHFFTWRNISNTCPLVFWWGQNGWYPLFPVKNRGIR